MNISSASLERQMPGAIVQRGQGGAGSMQDENSVLAALGFPTGANRFIHRSLKESISTTAIPAGAILALA